MSVDKPTESKSDEKIESKKDDEKIVEEVASKTESVENKKTEKEKQSKAEEEPRRFENQTQPIQNGLRMPKSFQGINYKKKLIRQANHILLRLRQLVYIIHEIIGDEIAVKIDEDENNTEESSSNPIPDLQISKVLQDLPAEW